ncbi:MAG: HAMP domain-containing histidine kinase [Bacteroidetes bacterium]|nr:MAG: HAMP domain-containing histidine kinase [Bacteroidota bacterium]
MKLSNRAIGFVISLATLSLIGLSVMQVFNLKSSIKTNNQIFLQKVDLVSGSLGTRFLEHDNYPHLLHHAVERARKSGNISDGEMDQRIREVIEEAMHEYNLDLAYQYGIYVHKENSEELLFTFVIGDSALEGEDINLGNCEILEQRKYGWSNLTCSKGYKNSGDYHLGLFFPSQEAYVFAQSSSALILSMAFLALLLCSFTYTLIVIRKQKKLSTIKNDFINNLTHEFKTPIASVLLAAGMLKRDYKEIDEKKRMNYLNLISHESKRLEGQVDKVLQIAMIDSGNFSLDKKLLNIHEVINKVMESMLIVVNEHKGSINLNLKASNPLVMADETHLVNIIYNLVDNALKYTMDNPNITITTSDGEDGIQIIIKDNGIGIGKEIQKYIFDKFYRAESGDVHSVKGFGLGLSYVKKIIEAHKGRIDLSSVLNQGTEFRLFFPIT